jgi:hypothetical protein
MHRSVIIACVSALLSVGPTACTNDDEELDAAAGELSWHLIAPVGTATRTGPVVVQFSKPVAVQISGEGSQAYGLSLSPPVSGSVYLRDRKTLEFIPEEPFLPATEYEVSVHAAASIVPALHPDGERRKFRTETFGLVGVVRRRLGSGHQACVLRFSHLVRREDLARYVRFHDEAGRQLPLRLEAMALARTYEITVLTADADSSLSLHVDRALGPVDGASGLGKDIIRVVPPTENEDVEIIDVRSEASGEVFVDLNGEVRPETVSEFVRIEPSVTFEVVPIRYGFGLKGDFRPDVSYRIRLRKGFETFDGRRLASDVERDVRVEKEAPSIRVDGQTDSVVFQGRPSAIEFRGAPRERLAWRALPVPEGALYATLRKAFRLESSCHALARSGMSCGAERFRSGMHLVSSLGSQVDRGVLALPASGRWSLPSSAVVHSGQPYILELRSVVRPWLRAQRLIFPSRFRLRGQWLGNSWSVSMEGSEASMGQAWLVSTSGATSEPVPVGPSRPALFLRESTLSSIAACARVGTHLSCRLTPRTDGQLGVTSVGTGPMADRDGIDIESRMAARAGGTVTGFASLTSEGGRAGPPRIQVRSAGGDRLLDFSVGEPLPKESSEGASSTTVYPWRWHVPSLLAPGRFILELLDANSGLRAEASVDIQGPRVLEASQDGAIAIEPERARVRFLKDGMTGETVADRRVRCRFRRQRDIASTTDRVLTGRSDELGERLTLETDSKGGCSLPWLLRGASVPVEVDARWQGTSVRTSTSIQPSSGRLGIVPQATEDGYRLTILALDAAGRPAIGGKTTVRIWRSDATGVLAPYQRTTLVRTSSAGQAIEGMFGYNQTYRIAIHGDATLAPLDRTLLFLRTAPEGARASRALSSDIGATRLSTPTDGVVDESTEARLAYASESYASQVRSASTNYKPATIRLESASVNRTMRLVIGDRRTYQFFSRFHELSGIPPLSCGIAAAQALTGLVMPRMLLAGGHEEERIRYLDERAIVLRQGIPAGERACLGSEDLDVGLLTAQALFRAGKDIDKTRLYAYLYGVAESESAPMEKRAFAVHVLGRLGEPVEPWLSRLEVPAVPPQTDLGLWIALSVQAGRTRDAQLLSRALGSYGVEVEEGEALSRLARSTIALLDVSPWHGAVGALRDHLEAAIDRTGMPSPQQLAWALFAVGRWDEVYATKEPYWGGLNVDGAVRRRFNSQSPAMEELVVPADTTTSLHVWITGAGQANLALLEMRVSTAHEAQGLKLTRTVQARGTDGNATDVTSVSRNQAVYVTVEVAADPETGQDLNVFAPVPPGFVVESVEAICKRRGDTPLVWGGDSGVGVRIVGEGSQGASVRLRLRSARAGKLRMAGARAWYGDTPWGGAETSSTDFTVR